MNRHLWRRVRVSAITVVLTTLVLLGSATAPISAHSTTCGPPTSSQHVGDVKSVAGNIFGAKANLLSRLGHCSSGTILNNTPLLWVGLAPTNVSGCTVNCVVQGGLVWASLSGGARALYVWWATGGCNGAIPTANVLPGALSQGTSYEFQITVGGGGNPSYGMYRNGVLFKSVPFSDSRISCWANAPGVRNKAIYEGERHQDGSTFGTSGNPSRSTSEAYQLSQNGGWTSINFTRCSVNDTTGTSHVVTCNHGTTNGFSIYD